MVNGTEFEYNSAVQAEKDKYKKWADIYSGNPPWQEKNIKSLNLGAVISAEISRLVTLEMVSEVNDKNIDVIFQKYVMRQIRDKVEKGLALGGFFLKPYVINGRIMVDFAIPSDCCVLSTEGDGTISEIYFKDFYVYKSNQYYVRIESHDFNMYTGNYKITNRFYRSSATGNLSTEIYDYSFLPKWDGIEREFELANIKAPLFGYFKPAVSNNTEPKNALGASVFSRAMDAMERADKQLTALMREFRVKEAKQYVSEMAAPTKRKCLPYLEDDYYIRLMSTGEAKNGQPFFESYSPDIHVQQYIDGLNEYLREVEDCVGLARGTLSPMQTVAMTATEIKASMQRTHVLVTENQKNLQECLNDAVYAISVWMKYPSIPTEYEVTTKFDDSIITDREAELKGMLEDVTLGYLKPEIYLAKKYGVTEKEALKMMPEQAEPMFGGGTYKDGEAG